MITLISKWKLRNGMQPQLAQALNEAVTNVLAQEPGTLVYSVHLSATPPLSVDRKQPHPPPAEIALEQQSELVFFEVYADADAFATHINGPIFTRFRDENIQYFYENPTRPGRPNTDTVFLDRQAAFFRCSTHKGD